MAKLHFYYSAMNAGKSTALLQSNYNYNERGMDTLLLSPIIDDRYGNKKITSRIGIQAEATIFNKNDNLFSVIKSILDLNNNLKCILIDEVQFITKEQVWQLASVTDNLNIPVLAYGLRTDFTGEPFEGSNYLLAIADQLIEIKTICHCGRKATMNIRIGQDGKVVRLGEQIVIGGNEHYIAVCRKHFIEGKISSY